MLREKNIHNFRSTGFRLLFKITADWYKTEHEKNRSHFYWNQTRSCAVPLPKHEGGSRAIILSCLAVIVVVVESVTSTSSYTEPFALRYQQYGTIQTSPVGVLSRIYWITRRGSKTMIPKAPAERWRREAEILHGLSIHEQAHPPTFVHLSRMRR